MRVALSFINYPMAIARYFQAALKRRTDVQLLTIGPFTGDWIPWSGGMRLPQKYAIRPDIVIPSNSRDVSSLHIPINFVERQLPWQPDLWIQVDAGFHLHGKPEHGKNVIVGTDPHVLDYSRQRTFADTFYCMQAHYAQPGDKYLPYAFDPVWHAPEDQPQNYDVCLIGLHYDNRNLLMSRLRDMGLRIYYDLGPCFDEARALYNQAPIGLNWSSLQDLTARVFELLGMRRLAVVNRVPDLERFFEPGYDLIAFSSVDDAVERIQYAIDNPDVARAIARNGNKKVQAHSWDARIEQILNGE